MKKCLFRGITLPLLFTAANSLAAPILEEVVVTASPHGKKVGDIAGAIAVLDEEGLQKQVSATLGETLQNQVGMANGSFGPGVGLPIMRGLSGPRVQVLQNSNSVGDASKVSPDHAIASEPLLADRIEILRGPATLRYGPGAIGGVVNIIDNSIHTETAEKPSGAFETRHDTNNDESVVVGRFDGALGKFNLHLSGVSRDSNNVEIPGAASELADDPAETSHGYLANTDTKADSWTVGSSWVSDHLVAGVSISQLDNQYGIPPGGHHHPEEHSPGEESESPPVTRIDMDQTNYQGKILLRELSGFIEQAQLDVSKTDYQHRELEIEDGMSHLGTRFDVQSQEARLELSHRPLANLNGTIGVHYSDRDLEALGEEAFVPPSQTRNNGIFVIEDVSIGSGSAELGMRYDQQSVNSKGIGSIDHNSLNLSASWIQPVTETQTVGLVLSRTERPPSAEELLANGEHVATQTYEVGALDLDTESAWNIEFNWRYSGDFDSNISLYHRVFSDFIYAQDTGTRLSHDLLDDGADGILACSSDLADFDNDPDHFAQALPCYAQSQEDARFSGIEAEITAPVGEQHNFRLWGDLVRARLDTGGDVPRIPPARIGASWHFSSGLWQLELSALHAFDQNRAGDNEADTDGYLRIDAYLSYGTGQWRLFIKGNNLTDREIRNATSYLREIAPQPGRSVVLGARLSF